MTDTNKNTDTSTNSIFDSLDEDEKKLLDKINAKIQKKLEAGYFAEKENLDKQPNTFTDFSKKPVPGIANPKHITDSPHEIAFTIKAEVSSIDNEGNVSAITDIVERFYFIPVKAKDDYKPYMDNFFQQFHEALEKTCVYQNKNQNNG